MLSDKEMIENNGGAKVTLSIIAVASSIGSFLLGLLEGLTNPNRCNTWR